jgi:cadmium resistance protein CadD (predicted permease)
MTSAILLSIAAFTATNIDNLFVLLAFFADADDRWRVVTGQYLGSISLVVLAAGLAALMLNVPRAYVGLIGIAPVVIGVGRLLQSARRRAAAEPQGESEVEAPPSRGNSSIWTVAVVAIANGSDNLSVYVPLFAGRPRQEGLAITAVFVAMIGLWCVLARWLVSHRLIGKPIGRYGRLLLPWVLILIGGSVILGNGTLEVFLTQATDQKVDALWVKSVGEGRK